MEKLLNPDFAQAKKFLKSLDPGSDLHTFQTFDDNADCKKTSLARTLNGTFEEHQDALVQLNNQGAGVFITVQRTDGTGRKKKNIVVIRSFFVEDDSGTGGIARIGGGAEGAGRPRSRIWTARRAVPVATRTPGRAPRLWTAAGDLGLHRGWLLVVGRWQDRPCSATPPHRGGNGGAAPGAKAKAA